MKCFCLRINTKMNNFSWHRMHLQPKTNKQFSSTNNFSEKFYKIHEQLYLGRVRFLSKTLQIHSITTDSPTEHSRHIRNHLFTNSIEFASPKSQSINHSGTQRLSNIPDKSSKHTISHFSRANDWSKPNRPKLKKKKKYMRTNYREKQKSQFSLFIITCDVFNQ